MPGAVTPQQIKNQQNALKGVSGTVKAPPPVPKGKPSKAVTTAPKAATKPVPTQLPTLFRHGSNAEPFPAKPPKLSPVEQKQASANTKALAQQQQAKQVNSYLASTAGKAKPELPAVVHVVGQGAHAVSDAASSVRNALSHAAFGGSAGTGRSGGGGAPLATVSPSALAQKVVTNIPADAINTMAEIPVSTYMTGKAALQAVEGHPGPLLNMGKQAIESFSPKNLVDHPVNAALLASGGLSALGRVADFGARSVGLGSDLARPDERAYGPVVTKRPNYSKDPGIRAREKLADSRPMTARHANLITGRKVDQLYGTAQTVWRNTRDRIYLERQKAITAQHTPAAMVRQAAANAKNPAEPLVHPEIAGKHADNLIIQGVLRRPETVRADLQKMHDFITAHPAEKGSVAESVQAATLGHIEGLQNDKRFLANPHAAFESAHKSAKALNALQPELVARGQVSAESAARAKLMPFAQLHMGAERGLTPAALAHDAAKESVSKAQKDLNAADRKVAEATTPAEHAGAVAHAHAMRQALEGARARERAAAIPPTQREGLVDPSSGREVTNQQINDAMRAAGINPEHIAHITHKAMSDEAARYGGIGRPPSKGANKQRTGTAFASGHFDPTHDAVVNQHLAAERLIHNDEVWRRVVHGLVVRKGDLPSGTSHGDFRTPAEARAMGEDPAFRAKHGIPDGVKMVPVNLFPPFVGKAQMTAMKGGFDSFHDPLDEAINHPEARSQTPITDALKAEEPGQYGLISQAAAKRLAEHEKSDGTFLRFVGGSANLFRKSVLPFSPKRIVGVPQETGIRLAVGRAGVSSRIMTAKLLNTMKSEDFQKVNPTAKRELDWMTAQLFGGTQSGQATRLTKFTPNTTYQGYRLEGLPDLMHGVKGTPGVGHVLHALDTTTSKILNWYKKRIEVPGQKAAYGKFALKMLEKETGMSWPKALQLQQAAMHDFAKGMLETKSMDAASRYVNTMMGQWGNHSPLMQDALKFAPFLSWYINSLKFMYATLPHEHPVITGLLAASNMATTQQRAALGLSGPLSGNPSEVQGYEEGGIPLSNGRLLDLAHYSPFSAAGDLLGSPLSEVLPQGMPLIQSAAGLDYTWRYPKNAAGVRTPPSIVDRFKLGLEGMLGTITPLQALLKVGNANTFAQPFRTFAPNSISPQSSGLGVSSSDLGVSPGQLGTSKSDLGVSNTQLGIP